MRVEPRRIIKTLKKNNGAVRKTARELDISPSTVINWRRRAVGSRAMSTTNPSVRLKHLKENVTRLSTRPITMRTGRGISGQDKKLY